jgi:hypothetical protein
MHWDKHWALQKAENEFPVVASPDGIQYQPFLMPASPLALYD